MTISEFFNYYYEVVCQGDLDFLDDLFHNESPFLQGVKNQYESLRKKLDINIFINTIELVAKQKDLLVVRDEVLLEINNQGENKNRYSSNLHLLTKKENGAWKIHSTITLKTAEA